MADKKPAAQPTAIQQPKASIPKQSPQSAAKVRAESHDRLRGK